MRPPLKHPFTEWRDMATRRLLGAIKEADVHPDVDVEAVAHSLVSFFVGTRVVGRSSNSSPASPAGWPRCGTS